MYTRPGPVRRTTSPSPPRMVLFQLPAFCTSYRTPSSHPTMCPLSTTYISPSVRSTVAIAPYDDTSRLPVPVHFNMNRPSREKKVFDPPHLLSMSMACDDARYEPDCRKTVRPSSSQLTMSPGSAGAKTTC